MVKRSVYNAVIDYDYIFPTIDYEQFMCVDDKECAPM